MSVRLSVKVKERASISVRVRVRSWVWGQEIRLRACPWAVARCIAIVRSQTDPVRVGARVSG